MSHSEDNNLSRNNSGSVMAARSSRKALFSEFRSSLRRLEINSVVSEERSVEKILDSETATREALSRIAVVAFVGPSGTGKSTLLKNTALPKLSLSGEAGAELRAAIMAGTEVTFHEKAINAHGWTGVGYMSHPVRLDRSGFL